MLKKYHFPQWSPQKKEKVRIKSIYKPNGLTVWESLIKVSFENPGTRFDSVSIRPFVEKVYGSNLSTSQITAAIKKLREETNLIIEIRDRHYIPRQYRFTKTKERIREVMNSKDK